MTRPPKDVAASVRQRLLSLARERREDFQVILLHYALERFLYRLGRSEHRDVFVLKGALLFTLWGGEPHRATRDLDLLGCGDASIPIMEKVFQEICRASVEADGLVFDDRSVRGGRIREDQVYQGIRIKIEAHLGVARIPLHVDIGFGDAVTPSPEMASFPAVLDFPAPRLRAYPRETVVAEKYQAMVVLGIANSRMKDFYDVWCLARRFRFDGLVLAKAVRATFERRGTSLPAGEPLALTASFFADGVKQTQWRAFIRKAGLQVDSALTEIVADLRTFLLPPTAALSGERPFAMEWPQGGPWGPAGTR